MAGWNKTTITICGGGHLAKSVAALAVSRDMFDIEILSLGHGTDLQDSKTTVVDMDRETETTLASMQLPQIRSEPTQCIPQSTVIILIVEKGEHEIYMKAIKDHIDKGTVLVVIPGAPCLELSCAEVLADTFSSCSIVSCDDVPWDACAGENVIEIKNTRSQLVCSLVSRCRPKRPPFFSLQVIFGQRPKLVTVRSWLESTLICNWLMLLSPIIVYGAWNNWDGKPVKEIPLFYKNLSSDCVGLIETVLEEIISLSEVLKNHILKSEFEHVLPFREMLRVKFCENDFSAMKNAQDMMDKLAVFGDTKHKMKESGESLQPDYDDIINDLEFGIIPLYGIAVLCEVQTIGMKKVIDWFQETCGKKYIVDGLLNGEDIQTTRCPQRFGITSIDELITLKGQ